MKKYYIFLFLLSFASFATFAQTEPNDRAKSKYAVNDFQKDDIYSAVDTYQVVRVKQPKGKKVKNVIMMIGDGMGLEQYSCAWVVNKGKLNMDNCPIVGFQRTYTLNKLITDSCGAGTALATGQKTNYGYISCGPDGKPIESVLKYAQNKGMKTGISVVCRVNDATPAVYCTHSTDRDDQLGIAAQYVDSKVDFLSGGGTRYWVNRPDGRNLLDEMKAKGYTVATDEAGLMAAKSLPFVGLYAPIENKPALDRGDLCRNAASKAISLLDNKKGFFLMIEGSCIDDYCHAHKIGYAMEELLDFDRTVGDVLKWAEKDGETLVIITADHSTGGLTLLDGNLKTGEIKVNFSTDGHNGIITPVFVYGPHAEDFNGIYENADLGRKIKKILSK